MEVFRYVFIAEITRIFTVFTYCLCFCLLIVAFHVLLSVVTLDQFNWLPVYYNNEISGHWRHYGSLHIFACIQPVQYGRAWQIEPALVVP